MLSEWELVKPYMRTIIKMSRSYITKSVFSIGIIHGEQTSLSSSFEVLQDPYLQSLSTLTSCKHQQQSTAPNQECRGLALRGTNVQTKWAAEGSPWADLTLHCPAPSIAPELVWRYFPNLESILIIGYAAWRRWFQCTISVVVRV